MSTLINQTGRPTASDILQAIALRGQTPGRKDVVDNGLDALLLETIIDELNAGRHYLLGWEPIDRWFRMPVRSSHRQHLLPYGPMLDEERVFNRHFDHPHTRLITEVGFRYKDRQGYMPISDTERGRYTFKHGESIELLYRICRLRVLYTKKGQWIVWVSWPESTFRTFDSVADMLQGIRDMTPDSFHLFDAKLNGNPNVDSIALYLCEGLVKFQQDSAEARKSMVLTDQLRTQKLHDLCRRFGIRPPS